VVSTNYLLVCSSTRRCSVPTIIWYVHLQDGVQYQLSFGMFIYKTVFSTNYHLVCSSTRRCFSVTGVITSSRRKFSSHSGVAARTVVLRILTPCLLVNTHLEVLTLSHLQIARPDVRGVWNFQKPLVLRHAALMGKLEISTQFHLKV
jgi:hypothetical protein